MSPLSSQDCPQCEETFKRTPACHLLLETKLVLGFVRPHFCAFALPFIFRTPSRALSLPSPTTAKSPCEKWVAPPADARPAFFQTPLLQSDPETKIFFLSLVICKRNSACVKTYRFFEGRGSFARWEPFSTGTRVSPASCSRVRVRGQRGPSVTGRRASCAPERSQWRSWCAPGGFGG